MPGRIVPLVVEIEGGIIIPTRDVTIGHALNLRAVPNENALSAHIAAMKVMSLRRVTGGIPLCEGHAVLNPVRNLEMTIFEIRGVHPLIIPEALDEISRAGIVPAVLRFPDKGRTRRQTA